MKQTNAARAPASVTDMTRALTFAAEAHANQRRKGAAQEPYLNHLVEVMDLVAQATGGKDIELLIAALLHDVVEDTVVTQQQLAETFGDRVARIVNENSDDMSLPKDERRRQRIAGMAKKSVDARVVKIADVISNLRAMATSPPAGWTADRKLGYLEGCRQLVSAGRGANSSLEAVFDDTAADTEQAIREESEGEVDEQLSDVRELEEGIGQPVHTVYVPNTRNRELGETDVDKLCGVIVRNFPSAVVQEAHGVFDGFRRPILVARIRTDSSAAIVALAQKLCLTFDERFVGVELAGRYIRIYADDTG